MKRMAKLQNWRIISVFFLGLCCAAASAWGEPITVKVTGVVNSIDFPTDSVQVGSSMVGFCSYDTETPDEDPSDYRGTYALNHLSMAIGNYTFTHNSASSEPALFDVWKTDMAYRAQCFYGIVTESGLPLSFYHVNIKLIDLCNASVGGPDDLLPVTFPDISFFTWRNKFEVTFSQSGTGYQIQGVLTSIEVVSEPSLPRVIYVDDDGTGDYPTIQAAIDAATDGDEVVLMPGTYTGDGNRDLDFANGLPEGQTRAITIRSTEPEDPAVVAATIIDCEYQGSGFYFYSNEGGGSIIDGLTITSCGEYDYDGGGIFCDGSSPTVANCNILSSIGYFGGGICNDNESTPTLVNCVFADNRSTYGGGVSNIKSDPTVINCAFSGNTAEDEGGGMYNDNSNPTVTNCTFTGNSAEYEGGGMLNNYYSNPTLTNCILWANMSPNGAQIYNAYMSSPTVTYSNVQGDSSGEGNIDTEPLFIDADGADNTPGTKDDNLRLQAGSQCIDAGDNSVVTAATDLDGKARIVNDTVDMGAYEFFYANTQPVADAGDDQIVYAWIDGIAEVVLDGSGSFDADGDELDYFWFVGDEQIATGVDPNVELAIGEHTIELIVNDGSEDSEPNEVLITVIELMPIEADVHIVPRVINRNNRLKRVMAIIRLPEGVGKGDVVRESFELYAGGLDGEPVGAILERVIGWGNMTRVFVLFDKDEVMNAVEDVGRVDLRVDLTVVGRLESGRYIYGSDTVRIVQPRRR